MKIPLVDLKAQYRTIKSEVQNAIGAVLEDCTFISSKRVEEFEHGFAKYVGVKHGIAVSSGTAALEISLRSLKLERDDAVIVPAHTFIATAEAITLCGARPVFVDVDERTYNIDVNQVENILRNSVGKRVKAIIAVHLYGHPADMQALTALADRYGVILIEDAAQAHGAQVGGRSVGAFGKMACFSFFPGKNLGAYGDAGMIVTNDADLAALCKMLRNHGRIDKYEHAVTGTNARMDEIQAAVLNVKFKYLNQWNEARNRVAEIYTRKLVNAPVILPTVLPDHHHVYHLYVIKMKHRNAVLKFLNERGIGAGIHYPIPLHRQPAYVGQFKDLELPNTDRLVNEILSLPVFPEMTAEDIDYVVETLKEGLERWSE